jgi:hypothetical protein
MFPAFLEFLKVYSFFKGMCGSVDFVRAEGVRRSGNRCSPYVLFVDY